jgi:predicted phosphodiesterase
MAPAIPLTPLVSRRIPNLVDLHQRLTYGQQSFDARPAPIDEVFEGRVATIAAGDPDNLGWRSTTLQDLNKVVVFGNDHSFHLTSLLEDLRILSSEKTKVFYVHRSALTKIT